MNVTNEITKWLLKVENNQNDEMRVLNFYQQMFAKLHHVKEHVGEVEVNTHYIQLIRSKLVNGKLAKQLFSPSDVKSIGCASSNLTIFIKIKGVCVQRDTIDIPFCSCNKLTAHNISTSLLTQFAFCAIT